MTTLKWCKIVLIPWLLVIAAKGADITPETAMLADRAGDTKEAIRQYESLAANSDIRSMITLGVKYHQAEGVPRNYEKAMDWYLKAYDKLDGDALSNIGVMYRDGQGVATNRQIAYLLFLTVHMEGLGSPDTQIRAGRCLSRLAGSLPQEEINHALCFTLAYVDQVVRSRGTNTLISNAVLPSAEHRRIKDMPWWLDSERARMSFDCLPPWNQDATQTVSESSAPTAAARSAADKLPDPRGHPEENK